MKNSEIASFLAGIGATEDIDSSGEIIEIKGIDTSSLCVDGKITWEHKSENSSQIVGKIVFCKKILKASDCDNDNQKMFWEKARKRPFLYVVGAFFDKMGHKSAQEVVASLQFDKHIDTSETNGMGWWSIEGSRLNKEGNVIKKCIARDFAYTARPCNKSCLAVLMTDEEADSLLKPIAKKKVENSMKKSLQEVSDLFKTEDKPKKTKKFKLDLSNPMRTSICKSLNKGNKYLPSLATPKADSKKLDYSPQPAGAIQQRTGQNQLENKPATQPQKLKTTTYRPNGMKTGRQLYNDPKFWDAPSDKPFKPDAVKKHLDENWEIFKHKDLLLGLIKKHQPNLNDEQCLDYAKHYASNDFKKGEAELVDLFEKNQPKKIKKSKRYYEKR